MKGRDMQWVYDESCRLRVDRLKASGCDAYCLFGMTGQEAYLARELNHLNEDCLAIPFLRVKRSSSNGRQELVQEALLKGYVFLFTPTGFDTALLRRGESAFRVLERREGGGLLEGEDRRYAEWALSYGGVLEVSEAVQIDDCVRIISGPLLDLQGSVTGFSRRNKNCRVQFEIMGRTLDMWLPYELLEPAEGGWRRGMKGEERIEARTLST